MLLALGFASQHLDFFAHFRVRVERLTTSDDNFTIIGCREGPRQPRSVERFQPPDPAGIEAVEVGSGLRRQRQARQTRRLHRICTVQMPASGGETALHYDEMGRESYRNSR